MISTLQNTENMHMYILIFQKNYSLSVNDNYTKICLKFTIVRILSTVYSVYNFFFMISTLQNTENMHMYILIFQKNYSLSVNDNYTKKFCLKFTIVRILSTVY